MLDLEGGEMVAFGISGFHVSAFHVSRFRVSEFHVSGFRVSAFQVSEFQRFRVSWFQGFFIFGRKKPMKKTFLSFCILMLFCSLRGQDLNSIYENNSLVSFEKYIYSTDSIFHSSVKPYRISDLRNAISYDSIKDSYTIKKFKGRKAAELIFNRNLIMLKKTEYGFTIDPLFDFSYGQDIINNTASWVNTRGFLIEGYIGRNLSFSTTFYESQSKPPIWLNNYVKERGVMPGQGLTKGFGKDAYDYGNSSGYFSYTPSRYFNFQAGQAKHFLGDGYRSLILSDNSSSSPFFMITTTFWKIKYINLWSQFSHPDITDHTNDDGSSVFAKKYSAMHFLSFAPSKKWNISLFEGILWQAHDSAFRRGFELSYLNPVIFLRPVEFNLGSFDNEFMGVNLRYSMGKKVAVYGQYMIDDMRTKDFLEGNGSFGNKYAWQVGMKSFDVFGITNLHLQAEYNSIRPYAYSHRAAVQSYTNAKQPLAHPSGANTNEGVLIAGYSYKRLFVNAKYVWQETGLDSTGTKFGKDIFAGYSSYPLEYGNRTTQGLYTVMNQAELSIAYLVNPATNANIFISATMRKEHNSVRTAEYRYISFGFRTSLRNLYYDFL
jgi:hypothetical protein